MADEHFLYTVTGLREPFYAAVDRETGRAWTSPTKDGAIRQANDAGIAGFVEQSISREKFLRTLGIENEPRLRIPAGPRRDPTSPPATPRDPWFVPDRDAARDNADALPFPIPRRLKGGKKSKSAKRGSPFAGKQIAPPTTGNATDDVVILPTIPEGIVGSNPFSDEAEELPGDD